MYFPCDNILCVIVYMIVMTVFIIYRHDAHMYAAYMYGYDVVSIMEKDRYTFRLSPETIQQLDELIAKGIIRNRTEGVINAIEMLHESTKYDTNTGEIADIISWAASPQIASEWHLFPVGAMFPIFKKNGDRTILTKMGSDQVEIVRDVNDHRLIIWARKGDGELGISSEKDYMFAVRAADMSDEEIKESTKKLNEERNRKK